MHLILKFKDNTHLKKMIHCRYLFMERLYKNNFKGIKHVRLLEKAVLFSAEVFSYSLLRILG